MHIVKVWSVSMYDKETVTGFVDYYHYWVQMTNKNVI